MLATRSSKAGFTLIEVLVTVSIVAILASLSATSYHFVILHTHRYQAKMLMTEIALQQSNFYAENGHYGALENLPIDTRSSRFSYKLTAKTDQEYLIQAKAINQQTADSGCSELTLTNELIGEPLLCW